MGKRKLRRLDTITEIRIGKTFRDEAPSVSVIADKTIREARLKRFDIFSIAKGEGQMVFEFRFKAISGESYPATSDILGLNVRKSLKGLQSALEKSRVAKPVGFKSEFWVKIGPSNIASYRSISEYSFRLSVIFVVNREERETFLEAAIRILGCYLDDFGISRKEARPDSFVRETYIMVPWEGKRKLQKILLEEHILKENGFNN